MAHYAVSDTDPNKGLKIAESVFNKLSSNVVTWPEHDSAFIEPLNFGERA